MRPDIRVESWEVEYGPVSHNIKDPQRMFYEAAQAEGQPILFEDRGSQQMVIVEGRLAAQRLWLLDKYTQEGWSVRSELIRAYSGEPELFFHYLSNCARKGGEDKLRERIFVLACQAQIVSKIGLDDWFVKAHILPEYEKLTSEGVEPLGRDESKALISTDIRQVYEESLYLMPDYIKTIENGKPVIRFTRPGGDQDCFDDDFMPERFKLNYENVCAPKRQMDLLGVLNDSYRFLGWAATDLRNLLKLQGAYDHPQSSYIIDAAFAEVARAVGREYIGSKDIWDLKERGRLMIDVTDLEKSIIWGE